MIIIAPQFPPAVKGGGPIKSLYGISEMLLKSGYKHTVITRNKDLGGSPLPEGKYVDNAIYLPKLSVSSLLPFFKNSKLIWINTIYSFRFSIIPLLTLFFTKKSIVLISPRGQLLQGAITNKKKIYLIIFKYLLLFIRHQVVIHFTNQEEKEQSLSIFNNFETICFNNPIFGNIKSANLTKNDNKNKVIGFFGRISPIKNIEFIIKLLPSLASGTVFQIHGTIEDLEYKQNLDSLIQSLNLKSRVIFFGNYNESNFIEKAKEVDVFVIPSFSENFCHVFFEAIEMHKIVIASNGLPWEEANKKVPNTIMHLEENTWINRINEIISMSDKTYTNEVNHLINYYQDLQNTVENEIINSINNLLIK